LPANAEFKALVKDHLHTPNVRLISLPGELAICGSKAAQYFLVWRKLVRQQDDVSA